MVEILVMLERSRFAKRIVAPITHHRFSMECLHPDRTVCPFWCHSNGKQDCAAFRLSSPLISPEIQFEYCASATRRQLYPRHLAERRRKR